MTIKEKIQTLENLSEELWEQLKGCEKSLTRAQEQSNKEEEKLFEESVHEARARWAMANRITKFLKNQIEAEEL